MRQLISIRVVAVIVGAFFAIMALWAFGTGLAAVASQGYLKEPSAEASFHQHPNHYDFSFDGPFGKWDVGQLQRGLKVYDEVCSACHSLKFVAFRDLADLGLSPAQIKAFAAKHQVPGVDKNTGEATTVPGLPTDHFPSPYPNDIAARAANNNAIPPDLSLITKARHGGADYVVSLITGYANPQTYKNEKGESLKQKFPDFTTPAGLHFNPYFANLNIAMPPPLHTNGQVTFDDGAPNDIKSMAEDVGAFLTWTAEPKLIKRRQTGWPVVIFLIFATGLAYLSKQQVWAAVKPKKHA